MNVNTRCEISVVIPVFNEEESIVSLVNEISAVMDARPESYEIIVVDDGSSDSTRAVLKNLGQNLTVICHKRNMGQSAGLASGFRHAGGASIVTLDGDGQNDPADIPALIERLNGTVDCVCGVRKVRNDSWVKRISSRIGNRFRDLVTGDHVVDSGCALRAIRRNALDEILVFNGMHRFLPSILRFQGYRVIEIPVNHRPRLRGESKYGIGNRVFRGLRDCFAMRWYKARVIKGDRLR